MTGPACRNIRQSLGVYVVGAIDPAERTLVDIHLASCPDCREELAGLAGLPALLGRVPAHDAERLILHSAEVKDLEQPPAELLSSLLRRVAERRAVRRWRGLAAAAAAVVIAVAGGAAGARIIGPAGHTIPGQVAVNASGQRWEAGSWTVPDGQRGSDYPASVSVAAAQVRSFEITSGGHVLVTVPAT